MLLIGFVALMLMAFTHRPSWLYYIDCQQARQIFSQPPFLKCVTKFAGFQRRSEQTVIVEFHEKEIIRSKYRLLG